jgi:hypothetical protein
MLPESRNLGDCADGGRYDPGFPSIFILFLDVKHIIPPLPEAIMKWWSLDERELDTG